MDGVVWCSVVCIVWHGMATKSENKCECNPVPYSTKTMRFNSLPASSCCSGLAHIAESSILDTEASRLANVACPAKQEANVWVFKFNAHCNWHRIFALKIPVSRVFYFTQQKKIDSSTNILHINIDYKRRAK